MKFVFRLLVVLGYVPVACSQETNYTQWRSKGASGGTRPGAQALEAQQYTFALILNVFFKHKFRSKHA